MDAFNQKGNIKIAGLGPGPCEQLPSAAIDAMKAADVIGAEDQDTPSRSDVGFLTDRLRKFRHVL